jgi:hypothetical protein
VFSVAQDLSDSVSTSLNFGSATRDGSGSRHTLLPLIPGRA